MSASWRCSNESHDTSQLLSTYLHGQTKGNADTESHHCYATAAILGYINFDLIAVSCVQDHATGTVFYRRASACKPFGRVRKPFLASSMTAQVYEPPSGIPTPTTSILPQLPPIPPPTQSIQLPGVGGRRDGGGAGIYRGGDWIQDRRHSG